MGDINEYTMHVENEELFFSYYIRCVMRFHGVVFIYEYLLQR